MPGVVQAAVASEIGQPLARRSPGELDLHHIDTGRGNCTLIVAPDGTTLMVDAGASNGPAETSSDPRPNTTRRTGEWQARYALRHTGASHLDYLLVTHIHPDHVGDLVATAPMAATGGYRLTGVSDVDALMPITTVIDRAFPDYSAAAAPTAPFATNYLAFLNQRKASGRSVQAASIGSDRQVQTADASFKVRILSANAKVWQPANTSPAPAPATSQQGSSEHSENGLSVALRLTFGRFSYYTGGDLDCDTHDGRDPQLDVETPVTQAAGRTEVATADHHGYFDACGPAFVRNLDAQVYIIQAWDLGHPGTAQIQRMQGMWGSKATHDVFATDILAANALTNRRFVPSLKSRRGHIVVRVAPGGDTYQIFVLDSSTEDGLVTGTFGPYRCRT